MKKLIAMLLLLTLLVTSLLGVTAIAMADTSMQKDIHLINPTSIVATDDGKLLVADKIQDNATVLHIFDISTANPNLVESHLIEGNINKLRFYNNTVYILQQDKYIELDINDMTFTTVDNAIMDIAIFGNIQFTIVDNKVYRDTSYTRFPGTQLVVTTNNDISQLLLLHDGAIGTATLDVNGNFAWADNDIVTTYNNIILTNHTYSQYSTTAISIGDNTISMPNGDTVISVASHGGDIYVLTSQNTVTKYTLDDTGYTMDETFVIGSDTVTLATPDIDSISSYTLVETTDYPANIIYKTTASDSVEQLYLLQGDTYLVLEYEGSENVGYHYVMYNNRLGWVKKSDNSTLASNDKAMRVIPTELDSVAQYKARFMSASMFVYSLPTNNVSKDPYLKYTFEQSITDPIEATLLQQVTATDSTVWYYVSYTIDTIQYYGWILQGEVGQIYSVIISDNVTLDKDHPRMKVNASLTEDINLYLTEHLDTDEKITDQVTEELITLDNGQRVNVITYGEKASYLQVILEDGTRYYGWIPTEHLISTNAITTTTIVGVTFITASLILIGIIVKVVKLRNSNKQSYDTELE